MSDSSNIMVPLLCKYITHNVIVCKLYLVRN